VNADGRGQAAARAAARGAIAAMAMTGMRRVTTGLGLVQEPPPVELARRSVLVSRIFDQVPHRNRDEVLEFAHWAYGAAGGAAFAGLWRSGVRSWWPGPVYGLAIWALFELGIARLLDLREKREPTLTERFFVAADHVLYGVVVAGRPRPHRG
jgi:hypothetical protein